MHDITTQNCQHYLVLVSLKVLELATSRKKGPSWPGLKVEGTRSYTPATASTVRTTNPDL